MVQNIMAGYIFGPANMYKDPANYYPIRLVSQKISISKMKLGNRS